MTHIKLCFCLLYFFTATGQAADPIADRVLSLPRWSDPFLSARFSGFLDGATPDRRMSYFFVTSESSSPEEDPVILCKYFWFI
jgi:hypothetical protein